MVDSQIYRNMHSRLRTLTRAVDYETTTHQFVPTLLELETSST